MNTELKIDSSRRRLQVIRWMLIQNSRAIDEQQKAK